MVSGINYINYILPRSTIILSTLHFKTNQFYCATCKSGYKPTSLELQTKTNFHTITHDLKHFTHTNL